MRGQPGHDTRPHARSPSCWQSSGHGSVDDRAAKHGFDSKLRWPLMCLAYFFDIQSICVYTTRHWQTSGRLVQELNVCTVAVFCEYKMGEIFVL